MIINRGLCIFIIYNLDIQIMSDDDLTRCIGKYFRQPIVDRNNLAKLMAYTEDFGARNFQVQMIQKIFRVAQSIMAKDNLKVIIKRYLHIINQILQKDQLLTQSFKYRQAVSAEIVTQFIIMLKNVFNYGPMDLFPDMKLYRKRWAKRINDQAYTAMQTEAQRQCKVDLDKGFTEDIVKKLIKSYQKRQFTKAELDKYLPVSNTQPSPETRKSSAVVSQSSDEGERTRKKVKRQSEERVASTRNQNRDMVMPSHSFIPSNSNTYGFASDPRRPNYPPQPVYHPYPYVQPPSTRVNNSAVGQMTDYYGHSNFYPPGPYNNYNYQNYYPPGFQGYNPTAPYAEQPRYDPPPQPTTTSKYHKILQKMDSLKKNWFFECKACGLMMITMEKYEEHKLEHFTQAQKQYEVSHSRAQHSRRGNKPLFATTQQWIQSNRVKLSDQKYQVLIEQDLHRNEICTICKGQLKVSWSDQLQNWVYEDAIKSRIKSCDNQIKSICHAECYHTINQFEKSSDELIK